MNVKEALKALNEIKKEDDFYFNGCFWIKANSFVDILNGNFELIGTRFLVNDSGEEVNGTSVSSKTHQNVWEKEFKDKYAVGYTFYPRGRVQHYRGKTWININSNINLPKVIDKIFQYYDLGRMNRETDIIISSEEGDHYKYQLQ